MAFHGDRLMNISEYIEHIFYVVMPELPPEVRYSIVINRFVVYLQPHILDWRLKLSAGG